MGSGFFIDTQNGRVATFRQLVEAGLVGDDDKPVAPWHPIKGPNDASTMWYAVMRKKIRGVFIGMLCIRHLDRQASLESQGWVEVPWDTIGVAARKGSGTVRADAEGPDSRTEGA